MINRQGTRPRDSQRTKVYAAENALLWYRKLGKFDNVEAASTWLHDEVLDRNWFKTRWPRIRAVDVQAKHHGSATGSPDRRQIRLPKRSLYQMIVIHELAHVCATPHEAWHGREWCQRFLEMVDRFIGEAEAEGLRKSFIEHGVKFKPKRRVARARDITVDQLVARNERLAKMREAQRLKRLAVATAEGRVRSVDGCPGVVEILPRGQQCRTRRMPKPKETFYSIGSGHFLAEKIR